MRNRITTITILILTWLRVSAQGVSIGDTQFTPATSALLELRSTSKGVLLPRLSSEEMLSVVNPSEGLLVYCTSGNGGFYWFRAGLWHPMADELGSHHAHMNLKMDGHYISGDGDSEGLWIDSIGNVGIGVSNPGSGLDLAGAVALRPAMVQLDNGSDQQLVRPETGIVIIEGPTGDFDIAGIGAGTDGQMLTIINPSIHDLKLMNESQMVPEANRILSLSAGGFTSFGSCAISLIYLSALQRWVLINVRK
jgi:hypothetical protein